MQENNTSTLLLIVSAVIALSAGVWVGFDSGKPAPAPKIQGVILPSAKTVVEFNLIDHKNNSFTLNNLKDKWSLLFVGYTQCPDVCPMALNILKQTHSLLKEKNIIPPQIVFISIDPERDTPEILAKYIRYFNEDFVGATGKVEELQKLASNLSVYYKKAAGSSGDIEADDYLMDHSSSFMLINPEGKLQAFLTAPHTPKQIIDSIYQTQIFYTN